MNKILLRAVVVSLFYVTNMVAMRGPKLQPAVQPATQQPQVNVASLLAQIEQMAVSQATQQAAQAYLLQLTDGINKIQRSEALAALPANEQDILKNALAKMSNKSVLTTKELALLQAARDRVKKFMSSHGWSQDMLAQMVALGNFPGRSELDYKAYVALYKPSRPLPPGPRANELTIKLAEALTPIYQAGIKSNNEEDAGGILVIAFYMAIKNLGKSATPEMKEMWDPEEMDKMIAQKGSEEATLFNKYKQKAAGFVPQLQAALQAISDAGKGYKFDDLFMYAQKQLGDLAKKWAALGISK